MERKTLGLLTEAAIMSALAVILGFVKFNGFWPNGGSVSLEMVPIFFMAFRRGLAGGLITGLAVGLLQLMFNFSAVHPLSIVLDYPIAFMAAGLAGMFALPAKEKASKRSLYLVTGIFLGCTVRFASHVLSGAVFFASYAPEGMNPWLYSVLYNGSYMLPIFLITSAAALFITSSSPRLIHTGRSKAEHAA
ncbi:energy-coupled thiamine transporter ThiT [Fictibacillus iocasae]|uniref:Energy-coupled thiamine transporter ThiT n=1 Tax=Fictibacillus iocasae TaxID=2715437 RepID=A0ABW2NNV4_9BACL